MSLQGRDEISRGEDAREPEKAASQLDALNTFEGPVIEVHISNIRKREEFRRNSHVLLRADGVIAGLGTDGYTLALCRLAKLVATN